MPYQIPMRNEDRYLFDANIGGQESSVLVWYQPSDGNWYIAISVDGNVLAAGVKLMPFARPFAGVEGFNGELVVFGNTEMGRYPWDDHYLIYYAPDEIG